MAWPLAYLASCVPDLQDGAVHLGKPFETAQGLPPGDRLCAVLERKGDAGADVIDTVAYIDEYCSLGTKNK